MIISNLSIKHLVLLKIFIFNCFLAYSQDSIVNAYKNNYQWTAVSEMHRTGIPASIKIAQGILESGKGQSTLAQNSKNHFGMKCKESWTGKTYYHNDDDYNDKGELIKSCFRVYEFPEQSYYDHSHFLLDRPYYTHLFEYDHTDYKSWAIGLREAKYASLATYDKALIRIIEKYKLNDLDTIQNLYSKVPLLTEKKFSYKVPLLDRTAFHQYKELTEVYYDNIFPNTSNPFQNKKEMVQSNLYGHSVMDVCKQKDLDVEKILKYNDYPSANQTLLPYEFVYIQSKRGKYKGDESPFTSTQLNYDPTTKYTHTVANHQTFHYIAQLYGIKLKNLYKLNRLPDDLEKEPALGEIIYLSKKRETPPKLVERSYSFQVEKFFTYLTGEKFNNPKQELSYQYVDHEVQPGESLWGLSRKYGTSLVSIRKENNLTSDTLEKGQILRLKIRVEESND